MERRNGKGKTRWLGFLGCLLFVASFAILSVSGFSSFIAMTGTPYASATISGTAVAVSESTVTRELTIGDISCDTSNFVYSESGFDSSGSIVLTGSITLSFSISGLSSTAAANSYNVYDDLGYGVGHPLTIGVSLENSTPAVLTTLVSNNGLYSIKHEAKGTTFTAFTNRAGTTSGEGSAVSITYPYSDEGRVGTIYCMMLLSYSFADATNWGTAYSSLSGNGNSATFNLSITIT